MINIKKFITIISLFILVCIICVFSIANIILAAIVTVECNDKSIYCEGPSCTGADGLGCFCTDGGMIVSLKSC